MWNLVSECGHFKKTHLPFRQHEGTERTIRQSNGAEHGACPFAAERDVES